MLDKTCHGVVIKTQGGLGLGVLVEQALWEHARKAYVHFRFAQKRPHLLFGRARPALTSRTTTKLRHCGQSWFDENLVSKQSPDQSPSLGLDPRKSGARLCADRLRAEGSVSAFPSQQEVNTR